MSGLCGTLARSSPAADSAVLAAMMERMRHRGPDGAHSHVDPERGLALGLVRLDAFAAGPDEEPPFADRDGLVIGLDGVVTNRPEILAALAVAPDPVVARSDAAVVAAAYRAFGAGVLARLDGPFALALWDRTHRRLILSRDKLGERSLYYGLDRRGSVVFASEIKAILAHPDVTPELDPDGLSLYLSFGYIPGPGTLFRGIRKLLPGEALHVEAGGEPRPERYWHLPPITNGDDDEARCVEELRTRFLEGLERYVNGAREVAVLLSGGVDSSIIVAGLKGLGVPRVATFTVGFDKRGHAEGGEDLHYARQVAARFGTEHHEVRIDAAHRPGRRLLRVIGQFDDLIMTPNSYSKFLLASAVREAGLNSVLTGSAAAGACGVHRKFLDPVKRAKLLEKTRECASDEERYLELRGRLFDFEEQRALLVKPPTLSRSQVLAVLHHYIGGIRSDDFFRLFLFSNLMISSTEKSLKVLDVAGHLASVSLRSPYLDRALVEYSTQLPPSFDGGKTFVSLKTHLKKAFEDELPEAVLERPVVGYPSYYWNGGELAEFRDRVLSRSAIESNGILQYEGVSKLLDEDAQSDAKSAGKWSWALTQFCLWYEIHIKRNPEFMEEPGVVANL